MENLTMKYDTNKVTRELAFNWVLGELKEGKTAGVIFNLKGERSGIWAI